MRTTMLFDKDDDGRMRPSQAWKKENCILPQIGRIAPKEEIWPPAYLLSGGISWALPLSVL